MQIEIISFNASTHYHSFLFKEKGQLRTGYCRPNAVPVRFRRNQKLFFKSVCLSCFFFMIIGFQWRASIVSKFV